MTSRHQKPDCSPAQQTTTTENTGASFSPVHKATTLTSLTTDIIPKSSKKKRKAKKAGPSPIPLPVVTSPLLRVQIPKDVPVSVERWLMEEDKVKCLTERLAQLAICGGL
ncbi:hypothetical protein DFH27DRAFT_607941 [Peziza echinospora]|nr:hypothetical protein DFH27DRAFT_607941 [Peziza echinospora]